MTLSPETTSSAPAPPGGDDPVVTPTPDDGSRRVRQVTVVVLIAAVVLGLVAWRAAASSDAAPDGTTATTDGVDWAGTVLGAPQEKPPIVLTDTTGAPFDLRAATEDELTLVMFGYTNCPDVCPINLATLSAALDQVEPEVRNQVTMVFVTADPERDTPEVLRGYLDQHDPDFVGLTGSPAEVAEAQRLADVPTAVRGETDDAGSYTVGHATQIIAYQPDGVARIVYPFGTRQVDWVRDLPRLVAGEEPTP